MFDCHIHSSFSADSQTPAEDICSKGVEIGMTGLAVTDHLDLDYPSPEQIFDIDFNEYSKVMDGLISRYENRLKVLKGIEVGIQPHVMDKTNDIVNRYSFDFVLSSIHVIGRTDPYYGEYFKGKTREESIIKYLEEIDYSVKNYKNYDVVSHIGYIRRYTSYDDKSLRYADFSDLMDSILKTIISDGKGIEVNSQGYRSGLGTPIPDYDIIRRYKELGGEILTIGSDAHYTEHIAHSFDLVRENLLNIGFKYATHFEKRKPVFDKL